MRYPFIVIAALILSVLVLLKFSSSSNSFVELFTQGNTHYRHNEYSQAIEDYSSAISEGLESGPLYYNLANAYYRNGEIGRAALNYERALQIMPRDSDLNYNYGFIMKKLPDYSISQKGFLERAIDKHIKFYSVNEAGSIIAGVLALMVLLNLAGLYFSWPKKRVRAGTVVLTVICIVYLIGAVFTVQYGKGRSVVLKTVPAKFEPKDSATVHFELMEGEKVHFLKEESRWVKIRRMDGKMGWVPAADIEHI